MTYNYKDFYGNTYSIKVLKNGKAKMKLDGKMKTYTNLTSAKRAMSRYCDGSYREI